MKTIYSDPNLNIKNGDHQGVSDALNWANGGSGFSDRKAFFKGQRFVYQ